MGLHGMLEGSWHVGQPKWHILTFVKPQQTYSEGCVSFTLFLHPHLLISQFQIQRHKPNCYTETL